jgi:hypothetical protein
MLIIEQICAKGTALSQICMLRTTAVRSSRGSNTYRRKQFDIINTFDK